MSVTISTTNKPLNPRAQDLSPKGYNRASLYSGKALDFDGVNDYVDISAIDETIIQSAFSFHTIIKKENNATDNDRIIDITIDSNNAFNLITDDASKKYGVRLKISGTNEVNQLVYSPIVFDELTAISFVWDGSIGSFYYNGQLVESTGSATIGFGIAGAFLGKRTDSVASTFFNGLMSGVLVFNTALTAAQVSDLYLNPEKIVPDGVANSALKLWLPMMEGAGTTAYDGSAPLTDYVTNGDFSDGTNNWSASNATLSVEGGALKITSTGGNRPQGYQTITGLTIGRKYLLSAVARVGTTSYNVEIEISGIGASGSYNKTTNSTDTYIYTEFTASSTTHIIQAKIDDSSVAAGETGYFDDIKLLDLGNYGSISGATWTSGVSAPVAQTALVGWNKMTPDHTNTILAPQGLTANKDIFGNLVSRNAFALNLDGKSWAEVHDNESLDFGSNSWSAECWVYWDGTSSGDGIISRWRSTERAMLFFTQSGSYFRLFTGVTNGSADFDISSSAISVGWRHLVGTYDSSDTKLRIYIDGALDVTSAAFANAYNSNAQSLEIGRFNNSTSGTFTNGIALPRIYNRALTATEVSRNYNADKSKFGL